MTSPSSAATSQTSSTPPTSTSTSSSTRPASTTTSSTSTASFAATAQPLTAWRRQRMIDTGAWNTACSVPFDDLRLVTLTYWGFDDTAHDGQLVLHRDAVDAVVTAMREVYAARFPIRRMVTVEAYGADDESSMRDDNTSAFNGRFVQDTTTCSQHAYGRAIDIDPLENPMIVDGRVSPSTAGAFVDRSQDVPGMIHPGDAVVRAFAAVGWSWGGDWHSLKDYQHFSANGR
ncbi:MAG: M15 family metallopeptidase [Dermatophilaceae bacterium]